MITLRQVNIKNLQNYFFSSMIIIKNVDPNLLSIDQISFKSIDFVIHHIEYITMKSLGNENIDGANFLYLIFDNVDAYTEESNEDKYLIFPSRDKNKEILENYTELWDEIKDQIETIRGNKPIEYKKDFMKIKFESDDDLPLGKILSIPVSIIVARSILQENNNYYLQVYLHECLYEYEYKYEDDSYSIV